MCFEYTNWYNAPFNIAPKTKKEREKEEDERQLDKQKQRDAVSDLHVLRTKGR